MRLQTTEEQAAAPQSIRVYWPDAVAFREAIQNPGLALADPALAGASVVCNRLGLPVAYSGRFAVVFRLRTPAGDWALRCFTQGTGAAERARRYQAIARHLKGVGAPFVPFHYRERGIKIGPEWFPVVAMRWAEGETLGRFVERHRADAAALRRLCGTLTVLLRDLEAAGIAHGDWQHDNLLVSEGGGRLTLVDYDGLFVPEMAGRLASERGHPNYQHPARTERHFGVGLDRFACLALQTGLLALARDPSLWTRFNDEESILFKRADFSNPQRSPVFRAVRPLATADAALAEQMAKLEAACRAGEAAVLLTEAPSLAATDAARGRDRAEPSTKWWVAPEAMSGVARPLPVEQEASPPLTGRYLSRLSLQEHRDTVYQNLWCLRAFLTGIVPFSIAAGAADLPEFVLLGGLVAIPTALFQRWPTRRLHTELLAEVETLQYALLAREKQLAEQRQRGESAAPQDFFDFATDFLEKVPINRALGVTGITLSTLQQLRTAGIYTAVDLRGRFSVPGIPGSHMSALQNWFSEREVEAAVAYRTARTPQSPTDTARLEQEIALYEAELAQLQSEANAFPDVSFGSYLRSVFARRNSP